MVGLAKLRLAKLVLAKVGHCRLGAQGVRGVRGVCVQEPEASGPELKNTFVESWARTGYDQLWPDQLWPKRSLAELTCALAVPRIVAFQQQPSDPDRPDKTALPRTALPDRPPPDRSFYPLLDVFSWNFGGVLGPSNVHVRALGLSCETPAAFGPPGFHTTARELPAHRSWPILRAPFGALTFSRFCASPPFKAPTL